MFSDLVGMVATKVSSGKHMTLEDIDHITSIAGNVITLLSAAAAATIFFVNTATKRQAR